MKESEAKPRKLRLTGKWTYIGIISAIIAAIWIIFTWLNIAFKWISILPF